MLGNLFKKKSKTPATPILEENHHFVLIEAPADLVAPQVILWGEASWWPQKSTMKFTKITPGEIKVGTRYQQKVLLPMGPSWDVEVSQLIPCKLIERIFLNGIFRGKETLLIEERSNGTKVDYIMRFYIVGFLNKILWSIHFKRLHNLNIEMILSSLKNFAITPKELS